MEGLEGLSRDWKGNLGGRVPGLQIPGDQRVSNVIDLVSAVKELHGLNSTDLYRLLRDAENFTIHYLTAKGLLLKIDMDKLAGSLPLHLTAVLISSDRDEAMFRYLLCGIRLLHSLCDLAPRLPKLDQIFLDDVKVLEQLIDLVIYMLIVLSGYRQEDHAFNPMYLLHSALVASNLNLLTGFISTQWQDIVHVLLAHPKVDLFMDATFGSVRMVVRCLDITLVACYKDRSMESDLTAERIVYYLCQQCEASLQFLQSLCQQKLFKERLLKNKELCGKGSILFLAQSILKLNIQSSFPARIVAAISRLKAKILSILLSLCEAESLSFLDEVASSSQSLDLAKSVALEVFDLLKTAFGRNPGPLTTTDRSYPKGLLQLNAMRLADIFSDDSNFRSYMTVCFTKVLTAIISLSHGDFLSCWCSSNLPETEEDASLEYDIFAAVGWVLDNTSLDLRNATILDLHLIPNNMPPASYAHNRTSLFVKGVSWRITITNYFYWLWGKSSSSIGRHNTRAENTNLGNGLDRQDLVEDKGIASKTVSRGARDMNKDTQNAETSGSDTSSAKGKNVTDPMDMGKLSKSIEHVKKVVAGETPEDEKVETVQRRKRKRTIMNDEQVKLIERAILDEPEMQRNAASLQSWADKLSLYDAEQESPVEQEMSLEEDESLDQLVADEASFDKCEEKGQRQGGRNVRDALRRAGACGKCAEKGDGAWSACGGGWWWASDSGSSEVSGSGGGGRREWVAPEGEQLVRAQLLNNRKARLARTAKDVRAADVDNSVSDKQRGPVLGSSDSPDSLGDARKDLLGLARIASGDNSEPSLAEFVNAAPLEIVRCNLGQYVVLVDRKGEGIGEGKVFQVHGKWHGKSLEALGAYVVDVFELKADKEQRLPYPSEATGTSFAEAETKLGVMRVLWDSRRILLLQSE
ncbi:nodulin homeobox [Sesbania bispinosa]|nr:nodulin homeobox [Sesbania bispinosa]